MFKYFPRNILVTGGAGFIGSHFLRYILLQPVTKLAVNLDKLTYAGSLRNVADLREDPRYCFVQGDVCNKMLVSQLLLEHDIDTIVHFAAETNVDRSISKSAVFIETNIFGTYQLLEAASHYWLNEKKYSFENCRFHHISTDEVFGALNRDEEAFVETRVYSPNSPYSASKASADHLVRAYFSTYHLPVTITHCSNNFGPGQHVEKFIPTVIRACLSGNIIPIYGDGKHIRDWLYVEDHCKSIYSVICKGALGESYNIGGENELDNLTLSNKICSIMDNLNPARSSHASLISFVPDRLGHDFRYAINTTKLKRAGLWHPPSFFEEALKETIKYFCEDYEYK